MIYGGDSSKVFITHTNQNSKNQYPYPYQNPYLSKYIVNTFQSKQRKSQMKFN